MSARRLLLLAVVRPTLEYGSEVWEANKSQAEMHKQKLIIVNSKQVEFYKHVV